MLSLALTSFSFTVNIVLVNVLHFHPFVHIRFIFHFIAHSVVIFLFTFLIHSRNGTQFVVDEKWRHPPRLLLTKEAEAAAEEKDARRGDAKAGDEGRPKLTHPPWTRRPAETPPQPSRADKGGTSSGLKPSDVCESALGTKRLLLILRLERSTDPIR